MLIPKYYSVKKILTNLLNPPPLNELLKDSLDTSNKIKNIFVLFVWPWIQLCRYLLMRNLHSQMVNIEKYHFFTDRITEECLQKEDIFHASNFFSDTAKLWSCSRKKNKNVFICHPWMLKDQANITDWTQKFYILKK